MDEREAGLTPASDAAGRGRSPNTGGDEGRSSEEIRREIDRTRAEMDETVGAIQQRLAPSNIVDQAWDSLKGGSGVAAQYAWDWIKHDPLPFALIGIGVAWLAVGGTPVVRRNLPSESSLTCGRIGGSGASGGTGVSSRSRRQRQGSVSYDVAGTSGATGGTGGTGDLSAYGGPGTARYQSGRSGSGARGRGRSSGAGSRGGTGMVGSAMGKVRDAASSAVESVSDATSSAAGTVRDWTSTAAGKASQATGYATEVVTDTFDEHPVLLGAVALAVGLAAGLAIPISRKEAQLMGETRDELMEQARTRGQDLVQKGKRVAERAVTAVKEEAKNISPENLAESGRRVVERATEEAKDEARKQNLTT
jgi:hypothetical protein